MEEQAENTIVE